MVTSDGGNTWETQFRLGKGILKSVHFLDSTYGWAVGDVGIVLCTCDGGATWQQSNVLPALNVSAARAAFWSHAAWVLIGCLGVVAGCGLLAKLLPRSR